jgi:hypothetical protein
VLGVGAEPEHDGSAVCHLRRETAQDGLEGARLDERHDVAGDQDQVEPRAEVEVAEPGEVGDPPVQAGRLLAGHRDHRGVDVDTHDVVPPLGQTYGDPPGATPGVEHPRRCREQPLDEAGLPVHVATGCRDPAESLGVPAGVVVAGAGAGDVLPPGHGVTVADGIAGRVGRGVGVGVGSGVVTSM